MPSPMAPTPRIKQTLSADKVSHAIKEMTSYLTARFDFSASIALVGIQSRGVILANRIAHEIKKSKGVDVSVGAIDITLYRDDFSTAGVNPVIGETHLDFDIDGRRIILIDDVLFTGRTIRAALDNLMDFGRPQSINLVVLIDRGHRELPIQAEFAPIKLVTERKDSVNLHMEEIDGRDDIVVCEAVLE